MKLTHAKKNSGFTLVELLVVIAIIAGLAAISSPIIIKQIAKSRATQAINNAHDIHIGLREYSIQRGNLPARGANSNAALALVFAYGIISDEKPFYVKGISGVVEGDGNITGVAVNAAGALTQGAALEQNSNAFSYFDDGTNGYNLTGANPNTPILATPVVTAGVFNAVVYNQAAFGGQAVVCRADGSSAAYGLNPAYTIADAAVLEIRDAANVDIGAAATCSLPDLATPLAN